MRVTLKVPFLTLFFLFSVLSSAAMAGTIKGNVKARGLRVPQNVVVYITKVSDSKLDLSATRFTVNQKNLSFLPELLVIPVGAEVAFPNNDQVDHNVFSLSRTKPFNFGNYGPGVTKTITFAKPGIVELRCDMHAEMAGHILVLKNVYFGITDKKGNFVIQDRTYLDKVGIKNVKELPPGKYTVRTWHKKLKSSKKNIIVPANGELVLNLKLKRGTPGRLYK